MIKISSIQTMSHNHLWSRANVTGKALLVWLSSLIIAASAQITVALQPVPVTLQTFAVIMLAMIGGWRLGLLASVSYLIEGLCGLPVFANFSAGLPYLFGPTGGYLLAFPLAAVVAGYLVQRGWGKYAISSLAVAGISLAIILGLGASYLAIFTGSKTAIVLGVQPFLIGEACKAIMLATMVPFFWKK